MPTQGTIALELLEQVPDLDAILIPISGGGLSSGIAIATKAISPKTKSEYNFQITFHKDSYVFKLVIF